MITEGERRRLDRPAWRWRRSWWCARSAARRGRRGGCTPRRGHPSSPAEGIRRGQRGSEGVRGVRREQRGGEQMGADGSRWDQRALVATESQKKTARIDSSSTCRASTTRGECAAKSTAAAKRWCALAIDTCVASKLESASSRRETVPLKRTPTRPSPTPPLYAKTAVARKRSSPSRLRAERSGWDQTGAEGSGYEQ